MASLSPRMIVARSVATAIRLSGLSVSATANQCGLSRTTIHRIISGKREATATALFRIAAATQVNPARLVDGALCKECITK